MKKYLFFLLFVFCASEVSAQIVQTSSVIVTRTKEPKVKKERKQLDSHTGYEQSVTFGMNYIFKNNNYFSSYYL